MDIVCCLGGDGVLLHASTLFTESVPPVISFALGSLGFLTSHDFKEYKVRAAHARASQHALGWRFIPY